MEEFDEKDLPSLIEFVNDAIESFEEIARNHKPSLKDDRFYSDKELSETLKVSRRTLQEWRNGGKIPYINLGGKVLYRESEIEKLLKDNYCPVWKHN